MEKISPHSDEYYNLIEAVIRKVCLHYHRSENDSKSFNKFFLSNPYFDFNSFKVDYSIAIKKTLKVSILNALDAFGISVPYEDPSFSDYYCFVLDKVDLYFDEP